MTYILWPQVKLDCSIEMLEHMIVEAFKNEFTNDDGEFTMAKLTQFLEVVISIKTEGSDMAD